MYDPAIKTEDLGKIYRLYSKPSDRISHVLGLDKLAPWKRSTYQEFWALRDINLSVPKGERLGIIGRNGAGKSTLLKIITGNLAATEGRVIVNGRIQALMELGTGFHPEFTGRENIRASLAYQGISSREIVEMEEEIIDFAELEEFIDQPVKTYSAGMYARLAFSTATSINPEVLIIDEILGAGDAYFAGKSVERMRILTEQTGATVLFVSHDLGSVQALCNRVIWIERGRILMDGEPLTVIKQYSAEARKEEEIRLKARDLKISKKQATMLLSDTDIYEKVLFRLVENSGTRPRGLHKIRSLKLLAREDEIGHIEVGAPMDNNPEQLNFVIDGPGYMDWGRSQKDGIGYFRPYADFCGRYCHAPFQFSIPRTILQASPQLILRLEGESDMEEAAVEVLDSTSQSYKRLGVLPVGAWQTSLVIEGLGKASASRNGEEVVKVVAGCSEPNPVRNPAVDEYGSRQAFLTSVVLHDGEGKESKIIFCREKFAVCMHYQTDVPINNPVFVFCIYLPSGQCATQWLVSSRELGAETLIGKGEVIFSSDSLLLGKGAYVASAAIFKNYPHNGLEPEAYHVMDRCIHFQIWERDADQIDYGLCRQPVEVKILAR